MLQFGTEFGMRFGQFFDRLLELLGGPTNDQNVIKTDAKISIEESRFRGRPTVKEIPGLVARRGGKGGGIPPPWGRRFGRKKEREV